MLLRDTRGRGYLSTSVPCVPSPVVCTTWRFYPLWRHSIAHTSCHHGGVPQRSFCVSCKPDWLAAYAICPPEEYSLPCRSFCIVARQMDGLFGDYEHPKRLVMRNLRLLFLVPLLLIAGSSAFAQQPRKVVINQDCSGPGGSNMQTLLTLIQSPQVEVLGINVVSGNQWRDEEEGHALALVEIICRIQCPAMPGSGFFFWPLQENCLSVEQSYCKVA